MAHAASMALSVSPSIAVVDYRRQSMVLRWHALQGTWSGCDVPPALVHGVALIRASQPNICLYARDGRLCLQVGADLYEFSETSPRIRFRRSLGSLGLRRSFTIESSGGDILFAHAVWNGQGDEFFSWLVTRVADPEWRRAHGQRWSEGVHPAVLRAS